MGGSPAAGIMSFPQKGLRKWQSALMDKSVQDSPWKGRHQGTTTAQQSDVMVTGDNPLPRLTEL